MNFEQRVSQKIEQRGYDILVRFAENILLRNEDNKKMFGEEKYKTFIKVVENTLEQYKQDDLYNYYYNFNKADHGFCNFERWKNRYITVTSL